MAPVETMLPRPEERERIRAQAIDAIPRWYNPYLHLALPTIFGLSVIAWAVSVLHQPSWLELLWVPAIYVLSNATEWRAHRDLLHKRTRIAPILYDRHTPQHHMIYVTRDMSVRAAREWCLVLIPAYGIVLIFIATCPVTIALWLLGEHNAAAFYAMTTMGYVVGYEWLHLSFHLPEDSFVGRLWLIRVLRRHHAIHHDPRIMQRYNFNVTVPLWDLVRGTMAPKAAREAATARGGEVAR